MLENYDPTAGYILTPAGPGKFVGYKNGIVTVEMDYMYLVAFDGNKCYID
jgi:hypothetical protein